MLDGMRIASLVPERTVPSIYRSLVPMQALAHRGHSVHVEERDDIRDPAALLDYDLVHVMRASHPLMLRLIRRLQQRGVAVAWDNDDERVAIVRETTRVPGQDGMAAQRFFATMRGITRAANLVTTPSVALAELHAEASGREVRILPNQLPPTFARPERVMPHQGVRIGWHAMPTHAASFAALELRETLEHLLARHAHVSIVAIGVDLEIRSRRYEHVPGIPYGVLPQQIVHFDIGLAPLAHTAVNEARSDVKLKEYAAAGVPWLASPIGPYAGRGEQQGGRLVADGDWFSAIEALMNDADTRRVLTQRGLRWAAGETIEAHVDVWEQAFEDAIEQAHASPAVR
jgi:glycosyltransferase involved in cell wall biosynthesis